MSDENGPPSRPSAPPGPDPPGHKMEASRRKGLPRRGKPLKRISLGRVKPPAAPAGSFVPPGHEPHTDHVPNSPKPV